MFKIAPGNFVKPPTPTMPGWCSNQLSYAPIVLPSLNNHTENNCFSGKIAQVDYFKHRDNS